MSACTSDKRAVLALCLYLVKNGDELKNPFLKIISHIPLKAIYSQFISVFLDRKTAGRTGAGWSTVISEASSLC